MKYRVNEGGGNNNDGDYGDDHDDHDDDHDYVHDGNNYYNDENDDELWLGFQDLLWFHNSKLGQSLQLRDYDVGGDNS